MSLEPSRGGSRGQGGRVPREKSGPLVAPTAPSEVIMTQAYC